MNKTEEELVTTAAEVQQFIAENVKYKNFEFFVTEREENPHLMDLNIHFVCPCNDTKEPIKIQAHVVLRIEYSILNVLDQIWRKIQNIEIHEASEQLWIVGKQLYKDHMEYRRDERPQAEIDIIEAWNKQVNRS